MTKKPIRQPRKPQIEVKEKLTEDYKQALKMKKVKDKIDDLEFELYVKKAERNQLALEIFTNRKLDIYV